MYPPHTHDTWTVFSVDEGAVRYDLESRHHGVTGARITILPPHVVHDGRAAGAHGYRKRVLYVGTGVLPERSIGPAVDHPEVADPAVVRGVLALHRSLRDPDDTLEAESLLAVVGAQLARHLGARTEASDLRPESEIAAELREFLDERRFASFTLADAAETLHVSRAHLVRSFTRAFGISPHRYVVARSIDAARGRLLDGEPIADVAVGVGFHDQAHLTRQFRRHVGSTPARYVRGFGPLDT